MASAYRQIYDGQWDEPPMRNYRVMCCDCNLIHTYNFRIKHVGNKHKLFVQAIRDDKATKISRARTSRSAKCK